MSISLIKISHVFKEKKSSLQAAIEYVVPPTEKNDTLVFQVQRHLYLIICENLFTHMALSN